MVRRRRLCARGARALLQRRPARRDLPRPGGIRLLPPSGVDTTVREATLTAAFPVGAHGELRAEARGDFSNQNVFVVGGLPNDHQFQFLAAALAGF